MKTKKILKSTTTLFLRRRRDENFLFDFHVEGKKTRERVNNIIVVYRYRVIISSLEDRPDIIIILQPSRKEWGKKEMKWNKRVVRTKRRYLKFTLK